MKLVMHALLHIVTAPVPAGVHCSILSQGQPCTCMWGLAADVGRALGCPILAWAIIIMKGTLKIIILIKGHSLQRALP